MPNLARLNSLVSHDLVKKVACKAGKRSSEDHIDRP